MKARQQNSHALVLLRRDLRLQDNRALHAASLASQRVTVCFILDPRQLAEHAWQSQPGLSFMLATLMQLHDELVASGSGLLVEQGEPATVLSHLLASDEFDAVYANRDYTPFSRRRDEQLDACCRDKAVSMRWSDDALLNAPGDVLNGSGKPYRVFTPFFRAACQKVPAQPLPAPASERLARMSERQREQSRAALQSVGAIEPHVAGGRKAALAIFDHLDAYAAYHEQRDIAGLDATTHLSAHLKFGTVSVREVYVAVFQQLGSEHALLRQLYWRDFFTHIAFFFPHVFGQAFDSRFEAIAWSEDAVAFQAWCDGKTGFPIVDAGMRELKQSGFMHNRLRMITASFLVKDMHIDWRLGEAWFARHLVDYDPAVNNGNWQWAASTGCDAQPWFRIFNPWLQQQRFDAECSYIKRWLPVLQGEDAATIHHWFRCGNPALHPLPILDHKVEAAKAKQLYKDAAQGVNDE
ncbi:MAG: deoxyribodipyrimidine photolyase [Zetaproteobacteria bacterium CG1_02_53_45]|nr:MAG: deoxyribodipyrimidine photolyase [Zetaproteobacteria bacterium CG1_02_53_45]